MEYGLTQVNYTQWKIILHPRKYVPIKYVQSLLGLVRYYRKFTENFSKIAKSLTKLTKKGEKFNLTAEQQNSFQLLKEKLSTSPKLNYSNFQQEFLVTTDASDFVIGVVLSQVPVGQDRPLAYTSRILCKAKKNYNTTEKEYVWEQLYGQQNIFDHTYMERNLK